MPLFCFWTFWSITINELDSRGITLLLCLVLPFENITFAKLAAEMSRKLFEKTEREWDVTVARYTIRSQLFSIKCSSAAFSSLYGFCFHFKVEFPSKIKLQMKSKCNYVDIVYFSSTLFSPSLAFPFPILISLTVRSWRSCFFNEGSFLQLSSAYHHNHLIPVRHWKKKCN